MKEDRNLIEKIGLFLYLIRREIAGVGLIVAALPFLAVILVVAAGKSENGHQYIIFSVVWILWISMQTNCILRRNGVCREILEYEKLEKERKNRIRKIKKLSTIELIFLCSLALSPLYFPISFILGREYRNLRREYEKYYDLPGGWDVENDLDKNFKKR